MHDNDKPSSSVEQDAWVDLAEKMRLQLERMIPDMPAMKPNELKDFVSAADDLCWLEKKARSYDFDEQLRSTRLTHSD